MRRVPESPRKGAIVDAITHLRADHDKVLAMFSRLEASPTSAGAPEDDQVRARKALVTELVMAESRHEAVEEQSFWPMVRDRVPDGADLAAHAVAQEAEAKRLLDRLEGMEPADPGFDDLLGQIVAAGRTHIAYEQDEVWPKVRVAVSAAELDEVGEKMAGAKKLAPTRPHPGAPSRAGAQTTAGPMAGVVDRLRDALTGRGRHR
jgi:phosphoglycolate phosphatase-like HAD superfamily hydrolase